MLNPKFNLLKTKNYYPAPISEKKEAVAEFIFTPQMNKEAMDRIYATQPIKEELTTHTSIHGKIFQSLIKVADPRIPLNSTQQVQSGGAAVRNEVIPLPETTTRLRTLARDNNQQAQSGGAAVKNEVIPLPETTPLKILARDNIQQAQSGGAAVRNEAIPLPETNSFRIRYDYLGLNPKKKILLNKLKSPLP